MTIEAEVGAPWEDSIGEKIHRKIGDFSTDETVVSKGRTTAFLVAPSDLVALLPERFGISPADLETALQVMLVDGPTSKVVAQIRLFPVESGAGTPLRLELRKGFEPKFSYKGRVQEADPQILSFFSKAIDLAKRPEGLKHHQERLAGLTKGKLTPQALKKAQDALKFADLHHRGVYRANGEPYLSHAWQTGRILMEECGIFDVDVIIASFLHDVYEDSDELSQKPGESYMKWGLKTEEDITSRFGERVASIVMPVTKPKPDGAEIKDRHEANVISRDNLRGGPVESILLRMADRLHNLRTLKVKSRIKQRITIAETLNVYMSIFRLAKDRYHEEYIILVKGIFSEINKRDPELLKRYLMSA